MKTPLLFAILNLAFAPATFGQGSLTPPPGPPAPTMKTLDQIEPRIIVNATNTPGDATNTFIISAPGSYYFAANITGEAGKHGISIQADDVTLDLNGFALVSGGGADVRGVDVPVAQSGFSIRNGSARGWTGGGVCAENAVTFAEKLRLSDNVGAAGLAVGNGSMIKDCVASGNTTGFFAADRSHVSNCIATINAGVGFNCSAYVTILDCTSSRNGGNGIVVLGSSSVIRCNASRNIQRNGSNGGTGITAGAGSTVADCTAGNNRYSGILAQESSVAGCTAHSNGLDGISGSGNSVSHCSAAFNGEDGIESSTGSVAHCRSSNNGYHGIDTSPGGAITNSAASSNARTGMQATQGSVTNCVVKLNGDHGIYGFQSVISFCRVSSNNQRNNGSVEIYGVGATLVSNNTDPAP